MNLEVTYQEQTIHNIYLWNRANLQEMSNNMIDFTSNFQLDYSIDSPIEQMWCSFATSY